MFALAIVALALRTALGFQAMQLFLMPLPHLWSPRRVIIVSLVEATITRLMYVLSDIVCAWRAVVLWHSDKRIVAILLLLILGTAAAAGCELRLRNPVAPSGQSGFQSDQGPLIMVGPTLTTNLVSTGLIAWKAWCGNRVEVKKHLGEANRSVRTERVFALLVESGFIYCCVWIAYLISALDLIPVPGFAVLDNVLLFVSGLYPTLIIILVATQMPCPILLDPLDRNPVHKGGSTRAAQGWRHYYMSRCTRTRPSRLKVLKPDATPIPAAISAKFRAAPKRVRPLQLPSFVVGICVVHCFIPDLAALTRALSPSTATHRACRRAPAYDTSRPAEGPARLLTTLFDLSASHFTSRPMYDSKRALDLKASTCAIASRVSTKEPS
ncbi:hypothetical protein EDB85DRAFT_2249167 [Lactarius pseudohatsudake]|nr:hypothetical protein EDB85DRAFT_2249167 [Lactarius pseudohatsudake]